MELPPNPHEDIQLSDEEVMEERELLVELDDPEITGRTLQHLNVYIDDETIRTLTIQDLAQMSKTCVPYNTLTRAMTSNKIEKQCVQALLKAFEWNGIYQTERTTLTGVMDDLCELRRGLGPGDVTQYVPGTWHSRHSKYMGSVPDSLQQRERVLCARRTKAS